MYAPMDCGSQRVHPHVRPVLLHLDCEAGHGVGSTKAQRLSGMADMYSFSLWQMGVVGFQP